MLAKQLSKRGESDLAARMLLRVAKSISKFPAHVTPILTSVVVACQKAGLKASAHEYATVLMRPEHRGDINPQFKRKIEAMIRRPAQSGAGASIDPSARAGGPRSIRATSIQNSRSVSNNVNT